MRRAMYGLLAIALVCIAGAARTWGDQHGSHPRLLYLALLLTGAFLSIDGLIAAQHIAATESNSTPSSGAYLKTAVGLALGIILAVFAATQLITPQ